MDNSLNCGIGKEGAHDCPGSLQAAGGGGCRGPSYLYPASLVQSSLEERLPEEVNSRGRGCGLGHVTAEVIRKRVNRGEAPGKGVSRPVTLNPG